MSQDPISLDGVPAASLRLLGEDVLVRPAPLEEERASGLLVTRGPSQNWLGDAFYGEVVAVGPGRLVETGPSPEEVGAFALGVFRETMHGVDRPDLADDFEMARHFALKFMDFLRERQAGRRVPTPWKPGDTVMVRQGFGPEVQLREGRHHVVGRGNSDHGHGILAAWTPGHVHCWHLEQDFGSDMQGDLDPYEEHVACCSCDIPSPALDPDPLIEKHLRAPALRTLLPSCRLKGPRLAEAVLGGKVSDVPIPSDAGPGFYEERPVDDGRHDV